MKVCYDMQKQDYNGQSTQLEVLCTTRNVWVIWNWITSKLTIESTDAQSKDFVWPYSFVYYTYKA